MHAYIHAYLFVYLLAVQLTFGLPARLLTCPLAYSPACILTYLPTSRPTYLLNYWLTYLVSFVAYLATYFLARFLLAVVHKCLRMSHNVREILLNKIPRGSSRVPIWNWGPKPYHAQSLGPNSILAL